MRGIDAVRWAQEHAPDAIPEDTAATIQERHDAAVRHLAAWIQRRHGGDGSPLYRIRIPGP